jgi:hypothetical protein
MTTVGKMAASADPCRGGVADDAGLSIAVGGVG